MRVCSNQSYTARARCASGLSAEGVAWSWATRGRWAKKEGSEEEEEEEDEESGVDREEWEVLEEEKEEREEEREEVWEEVSKEGCREAGRAVVTGTSVTAASVW